VKLCVIREENNHTETKLGPKARDERLLAESRICRGACDESEGRAAKFLSEGSSSGLAAGLPGEIVTCRGLIFDYYGLIINCVADGSSLAMIGGLGGPHPRTILVLNF